MASAACGRLARAARNALDCGVIRSSSSAANGGGWRWSSSGTGAAAAAPAPVAGAFIHGGRREYSPSPSPGGSTALIRDLRQRTGAPMKDVKAVLESCGWDSDVAFTELRKKGLAAASKKAGRIAADGLLGVAQESESSSSSSSPAAVVEINCETDFVARNDLFQHLVSQVAHAALDAESSPPLSAWEAGAISMESLKRLGVRLTHPKLNGETTVQEAVAEVGSIMGENVKLRRGFLMSPPSKSSGGLLTVYCHSTPRRDVARLVGIVTLEPTNESSALFEDVTHRADIRDVSSVLAMHVVAQKPLFLSKETISAEALRHERDILKSQAILSGKPEKFVEKMVDGRIRKYMEDVAFLEQKYVLDEGKTVKSVLSDLSKRVGVPVSVGKFLRMEVGDGIERAEKDFAAEVAAQAA